MKRIGFILSFLVTSLAVSNEVDKHDSKQGFKKIEKSVMNKNTSSQSSKKSAQSKTDIKTHLEIQDPYIYAPVAGFAATGGYGLFKNVTGKEIRVSIESAEGFKAVELHESFEKDGRMAMQRIDDIKIAAKKTFELKPGGYHLMLFDADTVKVKLGAKLKVTFKVNDQLETIEFLVKERMAKVDDEKKSQHDHH